MRCLDKAQTFRMETSGRKKRKMLLLGIGLEVLCLRREREKRRTGLGTEARLSYKHGVPGDGDGAVGGGMASGCPWAPGQARRVAHLKLGSLASLVRRVETGVEQSGGVARGGVARGGASGERGACAGVWNSYVDVENMDPWIASPKRLRLVFRAVVRYLHGRKRPRRPAIQGALTRG